MPAPARSATTSARRAIASPTSPSHPLRLRPALPMFKPAIRPEEAAQVGNYAIRFDWNDGHKHGIFSWRYLRDWCPCESCHAGRHSSDGLKFDIENHPPKEK